MYSGDFFSLPEKSFVLGLHQLHVADWQQQGKLLPLNPAIFSKLLQGPDGTAAKRSGSAISFSWSRASPFQVDLISRRLVISKTGASASGGALAEVPLLGAEVETAYEKESGKELLLLKPPVEGSALKAEGGHEASAWLLTVTGQGAAMADTLSAMGEAGAIRRDLERSIRLAKSPGYSTCFAEVWTAAIVSQDLVNQRDTGWWSRVSKSLTSHLHEALAKIMMKREKLAEKGIRKRKVVLEFPHKGATRPLDNPQRPCAEILRELQVLARLQGHPNFINLLGLCSLTSASAQTAGSGWAFVFENCKKGPVSALMATKPLDEREACILMRGVLRGLAHMHDSFYIHRDVKADAILIRSDLEPVLTDCSLCCAETDASALLYVCGTPSYMAPEQLTFGSKRTRKMDMWSAGVLLYYVLASRLPFRGKTLEATLTNVLLKEPNFEEVCTASPPCSELLAQLLQKFPKHRPDATTALQCRWFSSGIRKGLDVLAGPELASPRATRDREFSPRTPRTPVRSRSDHWAATNVPLQPSPTRGWKRPGFLPEPSDLTPVLPASQRKPTNARAKRVVSFEVRPETLPSFPDNAAPSLVMEALQACSLSPPDESDGDSSIDSDAFQGGVSRGVTDPLPEMPGINNSDRSDGSGDPIWSSDREVSGPVASIRTPQTIQRRSTTDDPSAIAVAMQRGAVRGAALAAAQVEEHLVQRRAQCETFKFQRREFNVLRPRIQRPFAQNFPVIVSTGPDSRVQLMPRTQTDSPRAEHDLMTPVASLRSSSPSLRALVSKASSVLPAAIPGTLDE